MPQEILKAVVVLRRAVDDRDFPVSQVICIPPSEADRLEKELLARRASGVLDMVQMGRIYVDITPRTPHSNEVDTFLAKIDAPVAQRIEL